MSAADRFSQSLLYGRSPSDRYRGEPYLTAINDILSGLGGKLFFNETAEQIRQYTLGLLPVHPPLQRGIISADHEKTNQQILGYMSEPQESKFTVGHQKELVHKEVPPYQRASRVPHTKTYSRKKQQQKKLGSSVDVKELPRLIKYYESCNMTLEAPSQHRIQTMLLLYYRTGCISLELLDSLHQHYERDQLAHQILQRLGIEKPFYDLKIFKQALIEAVAEKLYELLAQLFPHSSTNGLTSNRQQLWLASECQLAGLIQYDLRERLGSSIV
jgi:hypothetical protein